MWRSNGFPSVVGKVLGTPDRRLLPGRFVWEQAQAQPRHAHHQIKETPLALTAEAFLFCYVWWAIVDSNHGPQSYQDCALTT